MSSELLAFMALISVFVPPVYPFGQTDVFCEAFAANDYRIDLAYQHSINGSDHFFLAIDSNYWELEIFPESVFHAIKFKSINQGQMNADLKRIYRTAFQSAHRESNGQIQTGFLLRNDSVLSPPKDGIIKWLSLKYETSGQLATEADGTTTTIFPESRFPAALALKGREANTVCLLYQNQYFWANWTQTYNCYNFDGAGSTVATSTTWTNKTVQEMKALKQRFNQLRATPNSELTKDDADFTTTETAMNNLRDTREVVAIFRQKYANDFAYAFIYSEDSSLLYCIKDHGLYNAPCKNDDNVFADCSRFLTSSPQSPPAGP